VATFLAGEQTNENAGVSAGVRSSEVCARLEAGVTFERGIESSLGLRCELAAREVVLGHAVCLSVGARMAADDFLLEVGHRLDRLRWLGCCGHWSPL